MLFWSLNIYLYFVCASSEASGKSALRVHARGPTHYDLDGYEHVKPILYMHAQLSSREIKNCALVCLATATYTLYDRVFA